VITQLILDLLKSLFVDPLLSVLPTFSAAWGGTPLATYVHQVNAVFPIYWPVYLTGLFIQAALLMLPFAAMIWLWKVLKP